MNATYTKSAFLYRQVRRGLQSGRYIPGQRIDPTTLAKEFRTSPTPVRLALFRLVGEGLLEDQARSGLHVPLPTEVALRDLYDWMGRLLQTACELSRPGPEGPRSALDDAGEDLVKRTWQLFDEIARSTRHRELHYAVKAANNRLAPIRRAKQALLTQPAEELSELIEHWHKRDTGSLAAGLQLYHERRKQLVPCIVATLLEQDRLH
jgi:DNA-binding GntR family transcriptional regulator